MPISTTIAPMKISGPQVRAKLERSSQKLVLGPVDLHRRRRPAFGLAAAVRVAAGLAWLAGDAEGAALAPDLTHT